MTGVVPFYAPVALSDSTRRAVLDVAAFITVPVQFHQATDDPWVPQPDVERFVAALDAIHTPIELFIYPAQHGFMASNRPMFDSTSARLAWSRALPFLRAHAGVPVKPRPLAPHSAASPRREDRAVQRRCPTIRPNTLVTDGGATACLEERLVSRSRIGTAGLRLLFLVAMCGAGDRLTAQEAVPDGTHLRIHLITIGQGPAIWERFGHNAIVVEDTVTGRATAYDYGRFDFAAKGFILRFVQGRLTYWMASSDAHRLLGYYKGTGRQIVAQRLDLEPAERAAIRDALEANDTEATRYYEYDYYLDNCSTRVRDALDRVLGGAVAAALKGRPTGTTFRWHTLRVTANNPATWTGLDLALGPAVDRPIDAWEESFMPQQFAAHFATVTRAGRDGAQRPVVVETDTLDQGGKWPEPEAPPRWWPWFLLAGLVIGGSIRGLRERPGAFVVVAGFFAVVAGLAGLVVAGLWAFTDHAASYGNVNVLVVPVTGLLLAYFLPRAVREGPQSRAGRWARALALVAVVCCVAAAVLAITGITPQRPWELLALAGPAWVGLGVGLGVRRDGRE